MPSRLSRRDIVQAGVIAAVAILLSLPLLAGYALSGHDMFFYQIWGQQTAANLREGVLLPAWAIDLNNGFGGPGLILYPPLVNTIHALIRLTGLSLRTSISVASIVALFLSGVSMLACARSCFGSRFALAAAITYMAAPYRMIDMYERTALGEHWSFIWPPLILMATTRRNTSWRSKVASTALASAGLLLTNLPLAVLFGILLFCWMLFSDGAAPDRLALSGGAVLGLGLAAFALIPAFFSFRWVATELWFGPAASAGYRPSSNTIFSALATDSGFNMRVSVALAATFLLAFVGFFSARIESESRKERFIWGVAALACLVSTTAPFGSLWDVLPVLSKLQFPWRVSAPLTLALACLIALSRSKAGAWAITAAALAAALPFCGQSLETSEPDAARVSAGESRERVNRAAPVEAFGHGERSRKLLMIDSTFIPRGVTDLTLLAMAEMPSPLSRDISGRPAYFTRSPRAPIKVIEWSRLRRTFQVDSPGGTLLLRSVVFPGMSAAVDGVSVPHFREARTGLFALEVPPGRHLVRWEWQPFPLLVLARWVSVVALLGLIAILLPFRRAPRAPEASDPSRDAR